MHPVALPPRLRPRRVVALALAVCALAPSVGGTLHLALVPHVTLLASGQFVETEQHAAVAGAVEARPGFTTATSALTAAAPEACPICALHDASRRNAALPDARATDSSERDVRRIAASLHDAAHPARVAILHVAPKTSPPA